MYLNTISPAEGAKKSKIRVGRGTGSRRGKTCGRGHKGQHSRSGGYRKVGFEGGQMPIQRRLPKFGFTSLAALKRTEITLSELSKCAVDEISLSALRESNIISAKIKFVKIVNTGELGRAVNIKLQNIKVTKGALAAIEKAGGKVVEA